VFYSDVSEIIAVFHLNFCGENIAFTIAVAISSTQTFSRILEFLKFLETKMSGRKLRTGTRKNYKKMAGGESENGALSEVNNNNSNSDLDAHAFSVIENNNNNNKNGGLFTNSDLGLSSDENDPTLSESESDDDGDIQDAREKLMLLRKKQKKLKKNRTLTRIADETRQLEESMRELESGTKRRNEKKKLAISSLRRMDDVQDDVNRLMDKKMNIRTIVSTDDSYCDSESDDDLPAPSSTGKRRKSVREEKKRRSSGLHKSGKSKTLTSYVRFPQEWPHSHLSLNFVSRPKQYEELSIPEFCAGYAAILELEDEETRSYRTKHLKNLMYLATQYNWKNVLNFHAACLLEIERGNSTWRSDFRDLQTTTLAGGSFLVTRAIPREDTHLHLHHQEIRIQFFSARGTKEAHVNSQRIILETSWEIVDS
jgi:hypothetical protein